MAEIKGSSIIFRLKKAYLLATGFLMFFILVCSLIIILAINDNLTHADMINVAGRQRLLSHNINRCAFGIFLSETPERLEKYRMELSTSLELWMSVNRQLGELGQNKKNRNLFTPDVKNSYESITACQQSMADSASEILSLSAIPGFGREDLKPNLNIIMGMEQRYLNGTNRMVSLLEYQAEKSILKFRNMIFIMLLSAIMLLGGNIHFIFRPMQRFISRSINEIKRGQERIEKLAMTDELTGLYNRQYLTSIIYRTINHADRQSHDISFLLLDLDHFKRVNDSYGHPIGDSVLKSVAELIRESLRESDLPVRMGGEEFVILLLETDIEQAMTIAERIRASIEEYDFEVAGKLTVSIGVSRRYRGESFEHWYSRTDIALYDAKEQGRNRIASAIRSIAAGEADSIGWMPMLETGYEIIDGQHRAFFEYGKLMLSKDFRSHDREELLDDIDLILEELAEHFTDEEEVMSQSGYLNREEHKKIHESLLKKALWLKTAVREGRLTSDVFISYLWNDVIYGHVKNTDMDLISFLRRNRESPTPGPSGTTEKP
jgi:diguanylate cyclase (GGDEF)-like protein/hemerythrin-like metal-binding protein